MLTHLFSVKGLFDFSSEGTGELSFLADEILTVVRQDVGEGWWEARNSSGTIGLIPEAYVEIVSVPEPSIPPPPPPSFPAAPAMPPKPVFNSRPTSNWDTPVSVPSSAPPPKPAPPNFSNNDAQLRQESYDDWDDDWDDDDDDSTTADYPQDYQTQGQDLNPTTKEGGSTGDVSKFGTVRKGFNRFSTFAKQGGDAYLFGTITTNVPEEEMCSIVETAEGPHWRPTSDPFTCVIASPKKSTKFHGIKSFIAYQLTPSFSNIQVSRRYKHFDWLHERLILKYPSICVPPLPDKQISGRYEDDFINERMRQLQLWIDRMCKHPVIARSETFHHFLTCTDEKKWKVGKRKAEKDEFQGGKFYLTVQTPASPLVLDDVDNKIERFSRFVKSMDDSVRHLTVVGENNMKKHQNNFKKEFGKLGNSFISLSQSFRFDDRPSASKLTEAIDHTGNTYRNIGKLFEEQPRHDMQLLLEGLHEYKGMLSMFPETLSVHKAASQKMEESFTKLSQSEIDTARSRVDVISYTSLAEVNQFNLHRVGDFKQLMQNYLKGQIEFYQKVTNMLQGALQEVDNA